MKLIIGGAYQGKRRYAAKQYGIAPADMADGAALPPDEAFAKPCIYNFQFFVKSRLQSEGDFLKIVEWTKQLLQTNPSVLIIMDEVGSGIIPMEKSEREWREAAGRIGCLLAEHAESVERIICGLAVRIK